MDASSWLRWRRPVPWERGGEGEEERRRENMERLPVGEVGDLEVWWELLVVVVVGGEVVREPKRGMMVDG